MCGIYGYLYLNKEHAREDNLTTMSRSLRHRGPDDQHYYRSGHFGFGANRLSIIDLTNGRQPLSNENQTVWAVQNGEVYNYQTLRDGLSRQNHLFKTQSDTESYVHLYEQYGEQFAQHLRGMFAAAVWDDRQKKLILIRDRLGIKPLYYSLQSDRFIFASELKAILTHPIKKKINDQAVHDYLSLNYIPGTQTIFQGIYKLLPGCILVFAKGKVRVQPYWKLSHIKSAETLESESELIDGLRRQLENSVRYHLISDVPVGAFLSGGLDSSCVVAYASKALKTKLNTFSVGFKEQSYDEKMFARSVAKICQTNHHELDVTLNIPDLVTRIADYFDEPFADSSAIPTFAISEAARQHVKVILTGDGGDEIFGGYQIYKADQLLRFYRFFPSWMKQSFFPWLVHKLPVSHEKTSLDFKLRRFVRGGQQSGLLAHYLWRVIFTEEEKRRLYARTFQVHPTFEAIRDVSKTYHGNDLINSLLYTDIKTSLVDDMLTKVDRMSMANSLEVRVPLLDHPLVEFMASVPGNLKVRGLTVKYLLKKALRGILPDAIIDRPKSGFHAPVPQWIKTDLLDLTRDYLSPKKLNADGNFFNSTIVQRLLEEHIQGRADWSRNLWGILMFQLWYERYG